MRGAHKLSMRSVCAPHAEARTGTTAFPLAYAVTYVSHVSGSVSAADPLDTTSTCALPSVSSPPHLPPNKIDSHTYIHTCIHILEALPETGLRCARCGGGGDGRSLWVPAKLSPWTSGACRACGSTKPARITSMRLPVCVCVCVY